MPSLMYGRNEPRYQSLPLLNRVFLNSPIAGYSADGKPRHRMSLDALCRFFYIKADYRIAPPTPGTRDYYPPTATWQKHICKCMTRGEKKLKTHPEQFENWETTHMKRKKMFTFISQSSTYI